MPSKQVHFASDTISYSPPSVGSGSSSNPYQSSPLPNIGRVQLNYFLTPGVIQHALYNKPSHAMYKNFALAPEVLGQAATSIPLPSVTLVVRSPQLPYTITITPSHSPCVTVGDVLRGVHMALDHPASEKEFQSAPPAWQKEVARAFATRCQRRPEDQKQGLKRVDFLGSKSQWKGLAHDRTGPDVWELVVSSS